MRKTNNTIALTLFCLIITFFSQAQENKANLILGACASQIHGDNLGGYNKIGYTIGVSVERELKNNFIFQPEILYNKRGSSTSANNSFNYNITLKYLEIPILFGYKINDLFTTQGGLSFGRLISATESYGGGNIDFDNVRNLDSRLMAGIEYKALEKISIKMRYAISVVNIGKVGNLQNDSIDFLLLYYLN